MSALRCPGERRVGCGEVVRARALAPSRQGEKSPPPEHLLRGRGAHPRPRLAAAAAAPPAALQQRRQLRNGARAVVGRRRVKKAILRPSSPKEEMRPPSSVCCRRVLNVLEGFASVFYISNKSRLLAFAARTRRRIPVEKRRECNAVERCERGARACRNVNSGPVFTKIQLNSLVFTFGCVFGLNTRIHFSDLSIPHLGS